MVFSSLSFFSSVEGVRPDRLREFAELSEFPEFELRGVSPWPPIPTPHIHWSLTGRCGSCLLAEYVLDITNVFSIL